MFIFISIVNLRFKRRLFITNLRCYEINVFLEIVQGVDILRTIRYPLNVICEREIGEDSLELQK